jgi:hypothetical protein
MSAEACEVEPVAFLLFLRMILSEKPVSPGSSPGQAFFGIML